MPMVRESCHYDVNVFAREQLAEVVVRRNIHSKKFTGVPQALCFVVSVSVVLRTFGIVYVAEPNNLDSLVAEEILGIGSSLRPEAY